MFPRWLAYNYSPFFPPSFSAAKLPPHASQVAKREFSRLQKMSSHSPEQPMLRTYLELVAELPWSNKSAEEEIPVDVKKAREV